MTQTQAEALLSALEDAFDKRYRTQQRVLYVRELLRLDVDESGSHDLFRRLVYTCDKLPSLKDILRAAQARTEETWEIARSRPMGERSRQWLERSVDDYLAMEPLFADGELYEQYLDAVRGHQAGEITHEELRATRTSLIEQAKARAAQREAARR